MLTTSLVYSRIRPLTLLKNDTPPPCDAPGAQTEFSATDWVKLRRNLTPRAKPDIVSARKEQVSLSGLGAHWVRHCGWVHTGCVTVAGYTPHCGWVHTGCVTAAGCTLGASQWLGAHTGCITVAGCTLGASLRLGAHQVRHSITSAGCTLRALLQLGTHWIHHISRVHTGCVTAATLGATPWLGAHWVRHCGHTGYNTVAGCTLGATPWLFPHCMTG